MSLTRGAKIILHWSTASESNSIFFSLRQDKVMNYLFNEVKASWGKWERFWNFHSWNFSTQVSSLQRLSKYFFKWLFISFSSYLTFFRGFWRHFYHSLKNELFTEEKLLHWEMKQKNFEVFWLEYFADWSLRGEILQSATEEFLKNEWMKLWLVVGY